MQLVQDQILLSICIPAYNRPRWLARALRSIIKDISDHKQYIQVIISDDSESDECRQIARQILNPVNIQYKYVYNQSRLGMAANWNNSIKLASGKYVLILHDDDFLVNGAIDSIIDVIHQHHHEHLLFLFGVNVVNEQEKIIKKQSFTRKLYLNSQEALIKLLSNSSFVRFPAIVIQRQLFEEIGYFNTKIGEIADLQMWAKLFGKFGLLCVPDITCAYTVHTAALTTGMFNAKVIQQLLDVFSTIEQEKILPCKVIKQCKSEFFHQFILAGTYRKIKKRDFIEARKIMELFNLVSGEKIYFSWKWSGLRYLFKLILTAIRFPQLLLN